MNELKPCPFCGGSAKTQLPSRVYNDVIGKWFYIVHVACTNLYCRASLQDEGDTKELAAEAAAIRWNTRAHVEAQAARQCAVQEGGAE